MTDRIFDSQPQLSELETQVVACSPCDEGFCVELEATIFFPRGGGQPCENGTINATPVLDVYDRDGTICHITEREVGCGAAVCKIDLAQRLSNMRHHTAQHVISAAAHDLFGNETTIARIESDFAHIEFEREMTLDELCQLKAQAVEICAQNLKITCEYFSPQAAQTLDIRGKITPHEQIRIVSIDGFDKNACGGTHCESTGDILSLSFVGTKLVRGAFRLYFLAGEKSLEHAKLQEIRNLELGQLLCAPTPDLAHIAAIELVHRAQKLEEANAALKELLRQADTEILASQTEKIGDVPCICRSFAGRDMKQLRTVCEELLKTKPAVIMISNVLDDELSMLLLRHKTICPTDGADFGAELKTLLGKLGGKGGGNKIMAQGTCANSEAAQLLFCQLCDELKLSLESAQNHD